MVSRRLDSIKIPTDLAAAAAEARASSGKTATDIARHAGRSRGILYRLERGDDITVSALLDLHFGVLYGAPPTQARLAPMSDLLEQLRSACEPGGGVASRP